MARKLDAPLRSRGEERDDLVRTACAYVLGGSPRIADHAALARVVFRFLEASRPPGLLCVPCDGGDGSHAIDCPRRVWGQQ